jgi:uncharacterized small protein (DUF1192 family)
MRQQTLAVAGDGSFEKYRKPTRREIFLAEMDRIVSLQGAVAELDKTIAELNKEIERLTRIRSSLFSGVPTPGTPRPQPVVQSAVPVKKKRTLSAEGRKNILEANRRRWAAVKKAKK